MFFDRVKRELLPCGFRVLIKPDPVLKKTKSGIVVSVDDKLYRAATTIGTIVEIGPTAWRAYDDGQPWAKVGDRVYYAKYAGKIIDDGTEEGLVVLNDEDVQALIVKEEEVNE
ncbi:MAG: hypothetical protein WDZ61_00345 [Parcubacteria group bacterium]